MPERYELVIGARAVPDALPEFARAGPTQADGTVVVIAEVDENTQLYDLLRHVGQLGVEIISLRPAWPS